MQPDGSKTADPVEELAKYISKVMAAVGELEETLTQQLSRAHDELTAEAGDLPVNRLLAEQAARIAPAMLEAMHRSPEIKALAGKIETTSDRYKQAMTAKQ